MKEKHLKNHFKKKLTFLSNFFFQFCFQFQFCLIVLKNVMLINCKKKPTKNNSIGSSSELESESESNKDLIIYVFIALSFHIHLHPSNST